MAKIRRFPWSKGVWYVVYHDGRRSRKHSTGTTDKEEAQGDLAKFVADLAAPPKDCTVGQIVDAYLETLKDRRWYRNREYELRAVKDHFGAVPPAMINRGLVESFVAKRRRARKGLADSTLDRQLRALRRALAWAVQERWIPEAPYIPTPGGYVARERWLTRQEADKLIASCVEPHVRLFVLLALHTGARTRAILDLTWDRVDMENKVILYPPARQGSRKRTARPPINATLLAALEDARKFAKIDQVIEYRGEPVVSIKSGFQAAVRRSKIKPCTPHDLRRTCATWLILAGHSFDDVAKFLGDTPEVIERHYGHWHPEHLRAMAKSLES